MTKGELIMFFVEFKRVSDQKYIRINPLRIEHMEMDDKGDLCIHMAGGYVHIVDTDIYSADEVIENAMAYASSVIAKNFSPTKR
jgi:uncharacterized protein YlzI (FlbEa/FlbD family)